MRERVGIMQKDNFLIENMSKEDVTFVHKIEEECFFEPWSLQAFYDELENEFSVTFVTKMGNFYCGFINGRLINNEFYINNIAVSKEFRRQHIGIFLLKHLDKFLKNKAVFSTLEVRKTNIPAQNLYLKSGYEIVGERKNFYTNPTENAYIMTKFYSN